MSWFDAGVNLFDSRMPEAETLKQASDNGVSKLCLITTHPDEWEAAEQLYNRYPDVLCYTLGIHPHNAKIAKPAHWDLLVSMSTSPGVVAIGECGLDYNRDFSPRDIQRQVFDTQLALAVELKKPVYLHERDAFSDQVALLNCYHTQLTGGIAHCFTGDRQQMQTYLDWGFYIGITGWLCDIKRGTALREAVLSLPLDNVVLETDAPYLFPKTLTPRCRHNSPANLPHIGQQLALLLNTDIHYVEQASFANSLALFNL